MLVVTMLFALIIAKAQVAADIRVPIKSAMKMGVIDGNEVVIVPTIYENVAIYPEFKLVLLNKDGLWGYLIGRENDPGPYHQCQRPGLQWSARDYAGEEWQSGIQRGVHTGLLCVIDLFANVRYYVNPNVLLKTYKAYGNKNIQMDFNTQNIDYTAINNLFMGKQRTGRLIY